MPDFSIGSLLQRMGLRLPDNVTPPVDQQAADATALDNQKKLAAQRAQMPYWKGALLGLGTSIPKTLDDIVAHLSGKPNESEPYDVTSNGYRTGQDLGSLFLNSGGGETKDAAIPFPPGMKVFHGTKNTDKIVKEGFNYDYHNKGDILGWMAHFAEEPRVANGYAGYNNAGIIPARIDAERAVDTTAPHLEDVQRIAAQLPNRTARKQLFGSYNYTKDYDPVGSSFRQHIEDLTPEQFKATGLDAIRYRDTGDIDAPYVWAVPEPRRIINAISGEPMGGMFPKVNLSEEIPLGEGNGVLLRPSSKKDTSRKNILINDVPSFNSIKFKPSQYSPKLADFNPNDFFTTGEAGGTHGAFTVGEDYDNPQFVVKPNTNPLASAGEHIGSFIANQSNGETPVATQFDSHYGAKGGTFQSYLGKLPTIRDWGGLEKIITDHPEVIPKLQQEHVVDWLIGNHDAHSGQFFFDPNTSKLIPFDKGQSFKYYKADTLSPGYHPNAKYGEEEPVYNQLFKLAKEGKIKLDPQVAIDKAAELQKTLNGWDTSDKVNDLWLNHNYFAKQNGNQPIQANYFDRLVGLKDAFKTLYETHFPGSVKPPTKIGEYLDSWDPSTDPEFTKRYDAPSGIAKGKPAFFDGAGYTVDEPNIGTINFYGSSSQKYIDKITPEQLLQLYPNKSLVDAANKYAEDLKAKNPNNNWVEFQVTKKLTK